ncbi:MFS-type transporter SLC18B1-like [Ostrea edulis]|uniref:MFS-type transporter SLC18B1-like n=1 Tax=Ostrea edulis TaxID=37623 RepID=UPI0024AF0CA8|nr:MFS-type transporter SLC18B1-like [Ostrea edulis]XP_048742492.2 MFS-type transporter SLC18B1-like [Ostrea edulis]
MEDNERKSLLRNDGENSTTHRKEENKSSLPKIPNKKKILFVSMAMVNFFMVTCYSLIAPFFPAEAEKKDVSQTVVGMIFGVFELVIFLSSPVLGNYITKIGSKFMYLSGAMIGGTCAILFGVLDKSPDGITYIVMCFLCRTIEAFGCAMLITASFAIVANVFPDNVATMLGVLETASGIGVIVGPSVGGLLYEIGGFGLPFFVVGSITILNAVVGYFLIENTDETPRSGSQSMFFLLRNPFTWIISFTIASGTFTIGFLHPTLALHVAKLQELKGKTALIGLMFLISGGIFSFTAPVFGYFTDKKGYVKSMMAAGCLTAALGFLLMGPTPIGDQLPFELWSVIVSLALVGLGLGCAIIPTFRSLMDSAKALKMEENMDTYGVVAGLYNSCYSFGEFLGPTVGSALVDRFGFDWSATGCAGLLTTSAIIMTLYGLCKSPEENTHQGRSYHVITHESITNNKTPIKDEVTML